MRKTIGREIKRRIELHKKYGEKGLILDDFGLPPDWKPNVQDVRKRGFLVPPEDLFCEKFTCVYCNREFYQLPELRDKCPFCGMDKDYAPEKVMGWFTK